MSVRVDLHFDAFTQLRQSPEMQSAVTQVADRIASEANGRALHRGANYRALPAQLTEHGSVALATTGHGHNDRGSVNAMIDQAEYKTLSGVVGA